jgi:hypothetical protein
MYKFSKHFLYHEIEKQAREAVLLIFLRDNDKRHAHADTLLAP